ncbi:threonine-phosphate decarboxylase, partial [Acinetobacter baumannii]
MNLGHGGNIAQIARLHGIFEDSIIDFSANINPLGLCPNVLEAMIQSLDNIV